MTIKSVLFPPSEQFWALCAKHLIRSRSTDAAPLDFSELRVIVPAFAHAQWLSRAMKQELGNSFIPPRFNTLSRWLTMQLPIGEAVVPQSDGERLMSLYAQLREHAWLKKLFSARKNADLLPLAQTLIALSDELTEAMLPLVAQGSGEPELIWQQALAQLPASARQVVSEEAQLVWEIWKGQFDAQDPISQRYRQMLRLAEQAPDDLIWINPVAPKGMELQFLSAYGDRRSVQVITLDWRSTALEPVFAAAWRELPVPDAEPVEAVSAAPRHAISVLAADSLEQEARLAAQAIVDWLKVGKANIALVAQDRVVARRIRALLERAEIQVADETGWKLSTTRAAAALAAWFDLIASRAETVMLLDLIKSPYFLPNNMGATDDKSDWVMQIELTLLRDKIAGGWDAIIDALTGHPLCATLCRQLKHNANQYGQRKTLAQWLDQTLLHLGEMGMIDLWQGDAAGQQMTSLLDQLRQDCAAVGQSFTFVEWRAFVNLQLESTTFETEQHDQRVIMLPLNGARLRQFDAVMMVGCDAGHLPSQPQEQLFFTNAVRRECGLITREQRQIQQLRDFAELLSTNPEIILSYQSKTGDEDNPVSPWIERLNLCLLQSGLPRLPARTLELLRQPLQSVTTYQPRPAAPQLTPPALSASGYNQLMACPYQFFAGRMLKLSELEVLSDMPKKRDLGTWLHAILETYHTTLKARPELTDLAEQSALLLEISRDVFAKIVQSNPTALGMAQDWEQSVPAYARWNWERAKQGWHFDQGEVQAERHLAWQGGTVRLHGRIDRVDRDSDGRMAVLDYKTKAKVDLNKKLKLGQDQQLPFYGLLTHGEAETACYVGLKPTNDKIESVDAGENYAAACQALEMAIRDNMQAIAAGAPLVAQGIDAVCQYCELRGLCRKGAW